MGSVERMEFDVYGTKFSITFIYSNFQEGKYSRKYRSLLTFEQFLKSIKLIFSQAARELLHENPKLITSSKYEFQIKITDTKRFDESFVYYYEDISNAHVIYLEFNGHWLVEKVAVPWTKGNRTIEPAIKRILFAQMWHHWHSLTVKNKFELDLAKKLHAPLEEISDFSHLFLLMSFANMQMEGLAEFKKRQAATHDGYSIKIDRKAIDDFKDELNTLARTKTKALAEKEYRKLEKKRDIWMRTGIPYIGSIMCYTIGLDLMMNDPRIDKLYLMGKQHGMAKAKELGKLMGTESAVFCPPLPDDAYEQVCSHILGMNYTEFVKAYNLAGKKLDIDSKHMVVTGDLFNTLTEQAHEMLYKLHRRQEYLSGFTFQAGD